MPGSGLKSLVVVITLATAASSVSADVTLPALFSDGMVIQRQRPVHAWGSANPGETVIVTFRGESRTTVADATGRWDLHLPPGEAGGPFELVVRGANAKIVHDVLVGDVWLASGQSNMEWPTKLAADADAALAWADLPRVRLLRVKKSYADHPLDDAAVVPWIACSRESVADFSAVAYFFAREIHARQQVPIGVIDASWGGTIAESWTSLRALAADPALMPVFAARAAMMERRADDLRQQERERREQEAARAAGRPVPDFQWRPDPAVWAPAVLFNAMIAPLAPFPIRGVIWYQGESNSSAERRHTYERLFQALIRDWRTRWSQDDLPFLFVQLASFTSTPAEDWAEIREAQRRALALRNTAMAVTIDIGNPDDVHPTNKRDVGLRLALAARAAVYGEDIEYSGPLAREVTREGSSLRVWFDHATSGLESRGGALRSFEVAGADGSFIAADARIERSTLVVSAPGVDAPVHVRYGWSNSPECRLYNREGLPASPFTVSR